MKMEDYNLINILQNKWKDLDYSINTSSIINQRNYHPDTMLK